MGTGPTQSGQCCVKAPVSSETAEIPLWRGDPQFAFEKAGALLVDFRRERGDPPLSGSCRTTAWFRKGIDHFGARELTIFSKRGSPRSGFQTGNSFKAP
jgi:hypothetical protein